MIKPNFILIEIMLNTGMGLNGARLDNNAY